jgi:hemerythrin-like domain-containing protein
MLPIGPLMKEHRLIEKIVPILENELDKLKTEKPNPIFIEKVVDFFRIYADRTHHGKEEDILFKELENKDLNKDHKKTMNQLIEEHKEARDMVGGLLQAKDRYMNGEKQALQDIISLISKLTIFYPKHIEKEDEHFFIPVMDYFTEEEKDNMLQRFHDFDEQMIHEKYNKVIESINNNG